MDHQATPPISSPEANPSTVEDDEPEHSCNSTPNITSTVTATTSATGPPLVRLCSSESRRTSTIHSTIRRLSSSPNSSTSTGLSNPSHSPAPHSEPGQQYRKQPIELPRAVSVKLAAALFERVNATPKSPIHPLSPSGHGTGGTNTPSLEFSHRKQLIANNLSGGCSPSSPSSFSPLLSHLIEPDIVQKQTTNLMAQLSINNSNNSIAHEGSHHSIHQHYYHHLQREHQEPVPPSRSNRWHRARLSQPPPENPHPFPGPGEQGRNRSPSDINPTDRRVNSTNNSKPSSPSSAAIITARGIGQEEEHSKTAGGRRASPPLSLSAPTAPRSEHSADPTNASSPTSSSTPHLTTLASVIAQPISATPQLSEPPAQCGDTFQPSLSTRPPSLPTNHSQPPEHDGSINHHLVDDGMDSLFLEQEPRSSSSQLHHDSEVEDQQTHSDHQIETTQPIGLDDSQPLSEPLPNHQEPSRRARRRSRSTTATSSSTNTDLTDTRLNSNLTAEGSSKSLPRTKLASDLVIRSGISTQMTDVGVLIQAVRLALFEVQELRHATTAQPHSQSSPQPNPVQDRASNQASSSAVTPVDQALVKLEQKVAKTRQEIEGLNRRCEEDDQRAEEGPKKFLRKKLEGLMSEWELVEKDVRLLREELKEDQWLIVFRTVSGQAEEMMDSLERVTGLIKDFVLEARAKREAHTIFMDQSSVAGGSAKKYKINRHLETVTSSLKKKMKMRSRDEERSKDNLLSSYAEAEDDDEDDEDEDEMGFSLVKTTDELKRLRQEEEQETDLRELLKTYVGLRKNFETKKKHYLPSCQRVLGILAKGIESRSTKNGEVLRRFSDMKSRFLKIQDRIDRLELQLDEIEIWLRETEQARLALQQVETESAKWSQSNTSTSLQTIVTSNPKTPSKMMKLMSLKNSSSATCKSPKSIVPHRSKLSTTSRTSSSPSTVAAAQSTETASKARRVLSSMTDYLAQSSPSNRRTQYEVGRPRKLVTSSSAGVATSLSGLRTHVTPNGGSIPSGKAMSLCSNQSNHYLSIPYNAHSTPNPSPLSRSLNSSTLKNPLPNQRAAAQHGSARPTLNKMAQQPVPPIPRQMSYHQSTRSVSVLSHNAVDRRTTSAESSKPRWNISLKRVEDPIVSNYPGSLTTSRVENNKVGSKYMGGGRSASRLSYQSPGWNYRGSYGGIKKEEDDRSERSVQTVGWNPRPESRNSKIPMPTMKLSPSTKNNLKIERVSGVSNEERSRIVSKNNSRMKASMGSVEGKAAPRLYSQQDLVELQAIGIEEDQQEVLVS